MSKAGVYGPITLDNMALSGVANGQVPVWDSALGRWVPATVATEGGGAALEDLGSDWVVPTMQNGWVAYNYDAGNVDSYDQPGYRRSRDGTTVMLRGLIRNGTVNAAAFTMDEGFRPPYHLLLGTITSSTYGTGRVDIYADGRVEPRAPSSNSWLALDGLTFGLADV